ncbi:DUF4129 domain-containing protein [Pyxidicoccus xibeiensis]|uniref:DUF4129 domain-containing protein n=1 Tax=Pyxidicoccus xibeiensis TaxID=2906759 RepID=UPI0020A814A0|nr:DUF4129 domain-containing protein [Pyxidicoccus xibeiensis]MCP3141388.1 DUF4129 domain-containing protein [Pyxidicoccus xibeiensis]
MAVSALELRPRGAVALMDAAFRLCARNAGVWSLTLPGGVAVVSAALYLAEAVRLGQPVVLPTLWLTLAWFLRGLCQGAACHHVQGLLLDPKGEPTARESMRAALARAPALFITVAYLFAFNTLTVMLTLGIAFFVMVAQGVGYAAMMQGRGSPLRLYGVCSRLLGPARGTAAAVRILMGVQLLGFLNLHIALNFLLFLGRKLVGIDLTFAERFASLDNPQWLLFLAVTTFALFEPVRATIATLLLVDGRVRQEGLDLLAAVQQLPARNTGRPLGAARGSGTAAAVLAGVLGLGLLAPGTARAGAMGAVAPGGLALMSQDAEAPLPAEHAEGPLGRDAIARLAQDTQEPPSDDAETPDPSESDEAAPEEAEPPAPLEAEEDAVPVAPPRPSVAPTGEPGKDVKTPVTSGKDAVRRLGAVADACEGIGPTGDERFESLGALGPTEVGKLDRLVRTVERQAWDEEDCDTALGTLETGLTQATLTVDAQARADARAAASRAKDILARPEFAVAPPVEKAPDEPAPPPEPPGWWRRFIDWLGEFLKKLFERDPAPPPRADTPLVSGLDAANVLVIALVVLALGVLGGLLLRFMSRDRKGQGEAGLEVSTLDAAALAGDPAHALSRPPEGWAHLADELAARGEYREAVRSLYLALLSRLHRDGAILYDVTLSNWDYLRQFRGRSELKAPFRELTRRFDFAWYGNLPVGVEGYREFRTLTEPLLAAPRPEAAGA